MAKNCPFRTKNGGPDEEEVVGAAVPVDPLPAPLLLGEGHDPVPDAHVQGHVQDVEAEVQGQGENLGNMSTTKEVSLHSPRGLLGSMLPLAASVRSIVEALKKTSSASSQASMLKLVTWLHSKACHIRSATCHVGEWPEVRTFCVEHGKTLRSVQALNANSKGHRRQVPNVHVEVGCFERMPSGPQSCLSRLHSDGLLLPATVKTVAEARSRW